MDNSKAYYAFERPGWTKFQTFPENPIPGALLRPGSNFVCRTYRGGGAEERGGDRGRGATVDAREGAWGVRHHRRHLSPNVLTSGRIFGSALVEHTTMGTLSGL